MNLIMDESYGIKYAEFNEITTKIIEFLKKVMIQHILIIS